MRTRGRLFRLRALPGLFALLPFVRHVIEVSHPVEWTEAVLKWNEPHTWVDVIVYGLAIFGAWWIVQVAREPIADADRLTPGWLEDALTKASDASGEPLFDPAEVQRDLDKCYANLQDLGVFTKTATAKLLKSKAIRGALSAKYADRLRRTPVRFDPSGYTHWGAMLYRADKLEREEVLRYMSERFDTWRERGAN